MVLYEGSDTSKLSAKLESLTAEAKISKSTSASERTLYGFASGQQSKKFIEDLTANVTPTVLVVIAMTISAELEAARHLNSWYKEEHISLSSKIPGWLRTQIFISIGLAENLYLALHDCKTENGLGGLEHKNAMATPRRNIVVEKYVKDKFRRTYETAHVTSPRR